LIKAAGYWCAAEFLPKKLSCSVVGTAMEIHRLLRAGFLEKANEGALGLEFLLSHSPTNSKGSIIGHMHLREWLAKQIYDFLDVGRAPHPADCIFVMAGKQERKICGIKMWRIGFSDQLILSVDRFEWRKFANLNLESDGGLVSLVPQIPAPKRHFLVHLNHQQASCSLVAKSLFGTRSEARALAGYLCKTSIRSLMVVSSPAHLRRVAIAFRRAFRKSGIDPIFVAVPEEVAFDSSTVRAQIWAEFRKYLFYRFLLDF
jgi:hypothetical protein